MSIEIKAPQFPESVADGTVATWHKQEGDRVSRDELLVDIETDKVVLEVVAPADGVLGKIYHGEGDTIESQALLAVIEDGAGAGTAVPAAEAKSAPAPAAAAEDKTPVAGPAARKRLAEAGLDASKVEASGKGGRITRDDVDNALKQREQQKAAAPAAPAAVAPMPVASGDREERRVPMTRLRKRIAERLVDAQHNAAMLTTFNEVNMKPIMDMRKHYQADFEKAHGVRLGFMSFFVRACVEALKRFPMVNASIDGDDIVYHGYYDVGVAVSGDRGLVVPVLRDADQKGLAEIEADIIEFGKKARDGKLSIEEMTGGTFTISNGGVFGSLMSTPILNPPQTAILGMHKIQERPMAVDGKVEILPMMYLAVSYDHRLIDGREAVQFLVAIKQFIEDPARLLLDI
ncbi:MAG: 2-oxoglutarate dehydrogenase complex dihydrolipoyllysine-residue succinyltransferase [Alcanivoracaceae bacterium]|jgi:2-oxoglutarate dehydrogenase E2 component (dihydrolipoamide succinyltransferase)|nr:2-oxoglutarate dehydrogenase complex dihydrolipoyllysine-residue succinyltransferase [Alcanivoracaceae bacterium]